LYSFRVKSLFVQMPHNCGHEPPSSWQLHWQPGRLDWANFRLRIRWAVFENYRRSPNFWTTFLRKVMYSFWQKNGLGHTLGDIFTNSSGHLAWQSKVS
jgi:hypothetical protein